MRKLVLFSAVLLLLSGCGDPFPFSDHFTSSNLHPSYDLVEVDGTDAVEIINGRLRVTAAKGEDLWGGSPLKRGAPLVLHAVPAGEYRVESFVELFDPDTPGESTMPRFNTQAGLFVFQDEKNWLFFGFTFHRTQGGALPDGNGLIVTSTINDVSKIEFYEEFGPPLSGTLKIERWETGWLFYVRSGETWTQVGPTVVAPLGNNHRAGMGAKSFKHNGAVGRGYFDDFMIDYL